MVRVVAHRGASATHPENTAEAFAAALDQGAHGIELDVRRAADDVLVVHHDAHLADGRRILDLQTDDYPGWLLTLGQALDLCAGTWVNVEIKNMPDDPDYDADNAISLAVAGLLTAHILSSPGDDGEPGSASLAWEDRVLVSSFNVDSVARIREIDPTIPTGLLVWGQVDPAALVARANAHGFDAINPQDVLVDQSFVRRAHDAGLVVNVWTVDRPERIVELAELGVDGIITNTPGPALAALEAAGLS